MKSEEINFYANNYLSKHTNICFLQCECGGEIFLDRPYKLSQDGKKILHRCFSCGASVYLDDTYPKIMSFEYEGGYNLGTIQVRMLRESV